MTRHPAFLLCLMAAEVLAVTVDAGYRIFRTDVDLNLKAQALTSWGHAWHPRLTWNTTSTLGWVGALQRRKRNGEFRAGLELQPTRWARLEASTSGWRKKEAAEVLRERARGADVALGLELLTSEGLSVSQRVAAVNQEVSSQGLGSVPMSNDGWNGSSEVHLQRRLPQGTLHTELSWTSRNLRLEGRNHRSLTTTFDAGQARAVFSAHRKEDRYRTASVSEERHEEGNSLRLSGAGPSLSWEYAGASASTGYRRGTNEDFVTSSQECRIAASPLLVGVRPSVKLSLAEKRFDERRRAIYDREESFRALELGCKAVWGDSLVALDVGHQVSLNRTEYADPSSPSDHDIRDERVSAEVGLGGRGRRAAVRLVRRRNDLVYVDARRSANTVRHQEYELQLTWILLWGSARWSQRALVSARTSSYRFKPQATTLSRRGSLDGEFTVPWGGHEVRVSHRWVWDDHGPYLGGVFSRSELVDDVEAGIRIAKRQADRSTGVALTHRWRGWYGPQGRGQPLRPGQGELRGSWEVEGKWQGMAMKVAATRVLRGGQRWWEASVEVHRG